MLSIGQIKEDQEMVNYGVKYTCEFDPFTEDSEVYKLEILQKNYTDSSTSVKGGTTPVVQEWQTDDPNSPIKGSSLVITLINEGTLPLASFFSVADDEYKVIFYYKTAVLFVGFIVQDDCSETMVDFTHEINLSANDNLGLLKDLSLSKADSAFAYIPIGEQDITTLADHTLIVIASVGSQIQPGDSIKIVGGAAEDLLYPYTVKTVTDGGASFTIVFNEVIVSYAGKATLFIGKLALLDKKPLIQILEMCLGLTNLDLKLYVWGQINETSQDFTQSFLTQTLIDPQTFMNDDLSYKDCYTVLSYILSAFKFTLFQSNGAWQMVRWDELRYYKNRMTAFVFNPDLSVYGYSMLQPAFNTGLGKATYPETGLLHRLIRPYSYEKETYNFRQPPQLLRNFDFKTLGTEIRSYTWPVWVKGGNIYYSDPEDFVPSVHFAIKTYQVVKEYNAQWWYDSGLAPQVADYFIRVVFDTIGNEVARYMCAKNDNIKSFRIEANQGDAFKFTFSYATQDIQSSGGSYITNVFVVELNDGTTRQFLGNKGWKNAPGWTYDIPPDDNTNNYHTVTIDNSLYPIPFNGFLYFYLSGIADVVGTQNYTFTKEISLDYYYTVNGSTRITGQYHDNEQGKIIKNNSDTEIFVDDSPRNSICGSLFLDQLEGILQKRTSRWGHPYLSGQSERLGELVTFEDLFWRKQQRSILDGSFYGLTNTETLPYGCSIYVTIDPLAGTESVSISFTSTPPGTTGVTISYFNGKWNDVTGGMTSPKTLGIPEGIYIFRIIFIGAGVTYYFTDKLQHFSMLSVLNFDQVAGVNTVPGALSIDFKNNKFTGTLYEMYKDAEIDNDLSSSYTFNYLYKPI